ncbi:MAG: hypothetical protein WC947_08570, partial [Elusimicrobiota bacterium]
SDTTGVGSSTSPYNTVYKAVDQCASSGDAVYIRASTATYDVTYSANEGTCGSGGLHDFDKSIDFIGEGYNTVLVADGTEHTDRDHHCISTRGTNTKIYNIKFKFIGFGAGRNTNYMTSFFGYGSLETQAKIYNCVFVRTGTTVQPSMIYDNSAVSNIYLYNCLFETEYDWQGSYSGSTGLKTTQNVGFTKATTSIGITLTTCLSSVSDDAEYYITSAGWQNAGTGTNPNGTTAHIGVYGGTYAWGYWNNGTYKSNVMDTGLDNSKVYYSSWTPVTQPGGTNINVGVRASNTSFASGDGTPSWTPATNGGNPDVTGRYIQYMSTFTTTSSTTTPRIEDITIAYKVKPWQEKTTVRTGNNAFGFGGGESFEWEIPAKSGQLITVTAYIRYNTSYGSATKPKLTLYNLGISNTATMTQGADTWEQLTVSGTPNRNGVLKLKIEGYSTVPGAKMFVDDINISQ